MRRNLFNAGAALLLVPLTVFVVLKKMPTPPESVLAFKAPAHRVATAVDEAMRLELATATGIGSAEFGYPQLLSTNGKIVARNEVPEDDSGFLIPFTPVPGAPAVPALKPGTLLLESLEKADLQGKGRDGREVVITVKVDTIGEGTVVDFHGDEALAKALRPRIVDRLAHPKHLRGSPEDRAALIAFFGGKGISKRFAFAFAPTAPPPTPTIPTVDSAVKRVDVEVPVDSDEERP